MANKTFEQKTQTTTLKTTDIFPVQTGTVGSRVNQYIQESDLATIMTPQGAGLLNGKISVTVSSNNITVALKGADGNNPSATNPVLAWIGGTIRSVTSALSVTLAAGTNWCNAGAAELAALQQDYFVYIGYNATDGVTIGISRFPGASLYSEFSVTSTNEKYCAISTITHAASNDNYDVIGRFGATLSAGAGYTWTVPTFTGYNLKQYPIRETRWLTWTPATTCSGSLTYTSITNTWALYRLVGEKLEYSLRQTGTLGGTASTTIINTLPFNAKRSSTANVGGGFGQTAGGLSAVLTVSTGTPDKVGLTKYDISNFATSGTNVNSFQGFYEI